LPAASAASTGMMSTVTMGDVDAAAGMEACTRAKTSTSPTNVRASLVVGPWLHGPSDASGNLKV
jgi:hypothetical protein